MSKADEREDVARGRMEEKEEKEEDGGQEDRRTGGQDRIGEERISPDNRERYENPNHLFFWSTRSSCS